MSDHSTPSRNDVQPNRGPDRFQLFETPIFVFHRPELAAFDGELAELLLAERRSSAGVTRSNRGSFHSIPDLALRPDRCLRALMEVVVEHVRFVVDDLSRRRGVSASVPFRYAVHGWAMMMEDGDYTIPHDHADAHWSTIYYVDAGDPAPEDQPEAGTLAFIDPRPGVGGIPGVDLFPMTFTVRPRSHRLIVFPGWLRHYVHPYRGSRPRMSISCNVRMDLDSSPR